MISTNIDYDNIFNILPYDIFIIDNKLDVVYYQSKNKIFNKQKKIVSIKQILNDSNVNICSANVNKIMSNSDSKSFIIKEYFMNDNIYLDACLKLYNDNLYILYMRDISSTYRNNLIQKCCFSISEAIYQADDLDTLYKEIHFAVSEITNTNNFYISIADWENSTISFPYFIDKFDKQPTPRKFKKGLTEFVLKTGKSVLLSESSYDDFLKDNSIIVHGKRCVNWLGIPLKLNNNKTIGMIGIQSYNDSNMFHEEDLKALNLVSNQIATAIKRKKDDITIHKQAHYDALTGLTNKTLFYDRLDHAILQAERQDEVLAVLFLDIDDFKTVNDTMGHAAGDKLLKIVGNIIKSNVRKSDTVARWGGDEFCFLLPSIKNNEGIFKLCDRILNKSFKGISLLNKKIDVNASIGISLFPIDGEKPEDLLDNADKAMYKSKQNGKNQYKMFSSK